MYMGRRRKVEGFVLDLTRMVEGDGMTIKDLIVHDEEKPLVVNKERPLMCISNTCSRCGVHWRCYRKIDDSAVCYMCYVLSDASPEVVQLLRESYRRPCEFCGSNDEIKHFDHVNMFYKEYPILSMINMPIEEIQKELSKCQLLCLPCHSKVTTAEIRFGFMKRKAFLRRQGGRGIDVTELRREYAQEYEVIMTKVYDWLRRDNLMNNSE